MHKVTLPPAETDKDRDTPEIVVMWALPPMVLGGTAGFVLAGPLGAIIGAPLGAGLGAGLGAWAALRLARRTHAARDMTMTHQEGPDA